MSTQDTYINILPLVIDAQDEVIQDWMSSDEEYSFRQQLLLEVGKAVFAPPPEGVHYELLSGDSLDGGEYESGHIYVHPEDEFNFMLVMVHATFRSAADLLGAPAA